METPEPEKLDEIFGDCAITAHARFCKTAEQPYVPNDEEKFLFMLANPLTCNELAGKYLVDSSRIIRMLQLQIAELETDPQKKAISYQEFALYGRLEELVASMEEFDFSRITWDTFAKCKLRTKVGFTPLMYACAIGHADLLRHIMESP